MTCHTQIQPTAARVLLGVHDGDLRADIVVELSARPGLVLAAPADGLRHLVHRARGWRADVVVLDLTTEGLDVVEVSRLLADPAAEHRPRPLLLAEDGQDELVVAAIRAGARGAVARSCSAHEIGDAVCAVAAAGAYLDVPLTRRVLDRLTAPGRELAEVFPRLTRREREVVRYLAKGMTNAEIAGETALTLRTVKYHVSGILRKLGCRTRAQAAARVGAAADFPVLATKVEERAG
ncbi:helix-turn-helix transcriptional regulator [Amycolatopsis magusensis]|uniref:helix-turn-helix transcriptional regulator n=1 Tax=Amycolatopsis magusensis TaxID=882444 RepID=UPI0024A83A45|nr:LuxR C-terminal-related transcriptional regulator [Amycolatopsis magusensis]MDI5975105.1 LuxR C-terminal-related transcriptional regulator [Amycolatopsis magusensis]